MKNITASQCRYSLLTTALKRDIEQGKYPIGKTLPTESDLCQQFNVSRCTVREALRQLRQMGLVVSKQGSGTIVTANKTTSRYVQGVGSHEEFLEFLRQARPEILSRDIGLLPANLIEAYNVSNPQQLWLRIRVVRYWGDPELPTILTDVYVDAKYSGIKDTYDGTTTLGEAIEQQYGVVVTLFEQDIQAIALNKEQSQLLKAKLGSPALQTIRNCRTENGELLIIGYNVSPGDRYTYSSQMRITHHN